MKTIIPVFLVLLTLPFSFITKAQDTKNLSLSEVIDIALEQSPEAFLARHRFKASYWRFRSYKAEYLPSISLNTTVFDLNRSYSKIISDEGDDIIVERKSFSSNIGVTLNQNIGFTGGQIFLYSNLEGIKSLQEDGETSFLSTPFSIGFSQPLLAFNNLKWQRKIEPMLYTKAQKDYVSAVESIKINTVNHFFNLMLAQINVKMAEMNYSNNDTLYKISQGRFNIGTIAQNELLQMELNFLNSKTALNESKIDLEVKRSALRSFLGFNKKVSINLVLSGDIPRFKVDVEKAMNLAMQNNPRILELERQLIEAQREVARARTENRFNASLYATYGLTQTAYEMSDVYKDPQNQQKLRVGVEIPILDWGKGKGRYKMAQSTQEVVNITVKQAKTDFEQDIFLKVMRFNLQNEQVDIAAKKDTIGQSRYEVTKQRFLIGKVDVLNLNVALNEKDLAKRGYISALREYWNYYFTLRKETLYDFVENKPLEKVVEEF